LIVIACWLIGVLNGAPMKLQYLTDPNAICNDGTPAAFYFRSGTSTKWILYLEGGGFCYDKTSCDLRWKGSPSLMTSKLFGPDREGSGILSSNQSINAYWYDASVIDIMYWSSDSFSGNQLKSDLGWNFTGSVIVESIVQLALDKLGLRSATQVLFTGSSAGAEGLYPNADRVAKLLGTIPLLVALDSGWFLDEDPLVAGDCQQLTSCTEQKALMLGVPHWNPRLDAGCMAAKTPNTYYQCMLGKYAYPFLKVPSFVFEYNYDAAALGHDGIYHIPNTNEELAYANQASINVSLSLQAASASHFSASCFYHTIEVNDNWHKVLVNGKSYPQVLYEWTLAPHTPVTYRDTCVGPNCNPTCHYL